jgi:hypothetical protein
MTDIDSLIRRELELMGNGRYSGKDLAGAVFAKVRRRRIRRLAIAISTVMLFTVSSVGIYALGKVVSQHNFAKSNTGNNGAVGSKDSHALQPNQIDHLISDYPVTWEQSVGDLSAISKAGGIGDTLGGLTAAGLKVTWQACATGACPTTWILNVENRTGDIVTANPAIMLFVNHEPLESSSRPVTVTPGSSALLVFTFPELSKGLTVGSNSTWQWNWFLTPAH